MRCDRLWYNARLMTMAVESPGLGVIEDGVIAAKGGQIIYAGPAADAPRGIGRRGANRARRPVDPPGLIDCHTHLVHAGDRSGEFEQRLSGVTYEEIARAGGGILSTVRATRDASEPDLVAASIPRLDALLAEGVTTVEIKSGYGLDREAELRQLRAAKALARLRPVDVRTTYLGLHALPLEFAADREAYLELVCRELVPSVAAGGLAEAVDAFCEGIAFSAEETGRFFEAAKAAGLARSSTQTSSRTSTGRRSLPGTVRYRPIISSTLTRPAPWQWPPRAPLPYSCRGRSTCSARRKSLRWISSDASACRSPWPRTTTPAHRRSPLCSWR